MSEESYVPDADSSAPLQEPAWQTTPAASAPPPPSGYAAPPPQAAYTPPVYAAPPVAADNGLTDTAAGALAYVTIIPAIIFLVMAPYNTKPFIKFHAFQCLGLQVVWFCLAIIGIIPILGTLVFLLGTLALVVCWVMCIVKASQGSAFKLPVIGDFAAKQSGYTI